MAITLSSRASTQATADFRSSMCSSLRIIVRLRSKERPTISVDQWRQATPIKIGKDVGAAHTALIKWRMDALSMRCYVVRCTAAKYAHLRVS